MDASGEKTRCRAFCDYYDHLAKCDYAIVKCQYKECSAHMLRREIGEHEQNNCIYRHKMCVKGCGLMVSSFQEEKHDCVTALVALVKELKEDKANLQKTIDEMKTKMSVLHHEISPALSSSSSEISSISSTFRWSTTSGDWTDLDLHSLNSEVFENLSTSGHDSNSNHSLGEPNVDFLNSTGGNAENETLPSLPGDNSLAEVDSAAQSIATIVNANNKRSQDYDSVFFFKRAKPSSISDEGPSSSALPEISVSKKNSLRSQSSKNSTASSHGADVSSFLTKKGTDNGLLSSFLIQNGADNGLLTNKAGPSGASFQRESTRSHVGPQSSSQNAASTGLFSFQRSLYFADDAEVRPKTQRHRIYHSSYFDTDKDSPSSVKANSTGTCLTSQNGPVSVEAVDDAEAQVGVPKSSNGNARCTRSSTGLPQSTSSSVRGARSSTRIPQRCTRSSTGVRTRSSAKLQDRPVPLGEDVIPNVKVPPTAAYLLSKYTQEDSSEDESWSPSEGD